MKFLAIAVVIFALLIVACAPLENPAGDAAANTTETTPPPAPEAPEAPAVNTTETNASIYYTVEGTEGDLIQLTPEAIDPDGDRVTFSFTPPFNAQGQWQTSIGDEGKHLVSVGASDGKSTTVETVQVIVHRANRPPVIDCNDVLVSEGEDVDLHQACRITDEDDEEVIVTYGGWMGSWRYTTTYEDAGTHTVTITASDKRNGEILHSVMKNVTITVQNVNRPPVFLDTFPTQISGTENDIITIPREEVSDPDRDPITITYSAPFAPDGTWKTKLGDAGSYDVDVVVSDGENTVKRTVHITIGLLNTPPVLKTIPDITVKEGETIKLPISATDREGDQLTTTISGWMTSDTYRTTYDDAGSYTVKASVTDGVFTTDQIVHITVIDVNRPPVFVSPA